MPSTFASAAAGQNDNSTRRASGRADSADWSRRPNGATQTFRRPSFATAGGSHLSQRDTTSSPSTTSGTYQPPHSSSRNGLATTTRYSRDQLLSLYREQRDGGELANGLKDLFIGDFDPDQDESQSIDAISRPEVCLNPTADTEPLGLVEMSDEELEHFTSSVNSPLKAPNQGNQRDNMQRDGAGLRKSSMSHTQNATSVSTPLSARIPNRRDTSESYAWPRDSMSPAASRFGRDEQSFEAPLSITRRNTETKEGDAGRLDDRERGHNSRSSFGPLRRVSTGPVSAGVGGPQSPWSQAPGNAFGAFGFPSSTNEQTTRPSGLARGESRFKGLMNRDASNDDEPTLQERPSHASLERLGERDPDQPSRTREGSSRTGLDDNAAVNESRYGGRSAFSESREDLRDQRPGVNDQRRSSRPSFLGHAKISGFAGSDLHPWEEQHPNAQQDDPRGAMMQSGDEPQSPTYTNPYQSPRRPTANPHEADSNGSEFEGFHLPGLGSLRDDMMGGPTSSGPGFARTNSGYDSRPFERGPPTSAGPTRGLSGLGGLGGLPPIGNSSSRAAGYSSGTPSRERVLEGFGDPSTRSEGLQGLGSVGLPNERAGPASRSGRLGSLFPSGMQDQMKTEDAERQRRAPTEELDASNDPYAAFGNRASGRNFTPGANATRGGDSPPRFARAHYEDLDSSDPHSNMHDLYSSDKGSQHAQASAQSQGLLDHSQQQQPPGISNTSGQPPAAQQKTMVMPDRIRWIYRDPQGNTQGPWSGLEMHDWYRAGFFSPELLVKKAEDADYEPLAQLIRRIGNSREPFLVPQIGIPGPPSTANSGAWTPQAPAPATAPATAPAAQPPFASSFPSFGTTLTAEQQNALERRKQEEQYLMARQKEHLAQQQVLVKQMQLQSPHSAHQQPLQHHSSAHSLQSQPSYGSITSPGAYQTGHLAGTNPAQASHGTFDSAARQGPPAIGAGLEGLGNIEEEALSQEFGQFNLGGNQVGHRIEPHASQQGGQYSGQHSDNERIQAMLNDRARLQEEQERYDASNLNDEMEQMAQSGRLQQFHDLQQTLNDDQKQQLSADNDARMANEGGTFPSQTSKSSHAGRPDKHPKPQSLTLTEQVQQAAFSKESPATATQSPWAKVDKPITESHPVSQTSSPLPAPAARRSGGQSVADALAAGSSPSHVSPSAETTTVSVAPWAAKESADAPKQVSLKQIQEAEARRAAKQEEVQAAMRRAALEKEATAQPIAPAPGLPSSSTWASGDPLPSPSVSGPSAWAKATAAKPASISGPTKKTLLQIQKDEEAADKRRKALAAAATANNGGAKNAATAAIPAGKRYADLAGGGASQAPPGIAASAWTTVGASGKPRTPATPSFPAAAVRVASVDNASNAAAAPKVKPAVAPVRTNVSSTGFNAQDDFKKWAVAELRMDLKKGIQVDDFVSSLYSLPLETDLITEAVYASSSTLDSRHFAEEYVRRRALADKGKAQPPRGGASAIPNSSTAESKGSGGWSEVARKGPVAASKDESSAFKVVPSKKKGGKR